MKSGKSLLVIFLIILVAGLAAASFGAYYFYKQYQTIKQNPEMIAQQEEKLVVESLSKLMELPEGETPSIATILDIEKLMDQPFFKNANNGDKIVIYSQARKAILWRPATNKIIEVAPLVYDQVDGTSAITPSPRVTDEPLVEDEVSSTEIEEAPAVPSPTSTL